MSLLTVEFVRPQSMHIYEIDHFSQLCLIVNFNYHRFKAYGPNAIQHRLIISVIDNNICGHNSATEQPIYVFLPIVSRISLPPDSTCTYYKASIGSEFYGVWHWRI